MTPTKDIPAVTKANARQVITSTIEIKLSITFIVQVGFFRLRHVDACLDKPYLGYRSRGTVSSGHRMTGGCVVINITCALLCKRVWLTSKR